MKGVQTMGKRVYHVSFRCHYSTGNSTQHNAKIRLTEIGKWMEAYIFTHPDCQSITAKIWPRDKEV